MFESYLEHICDSLDPCIADLVFLKVNACNGVVCLLQVKQKDMVSGILKLARLKMHRKHYGGTDSLKMTVLGH